jgi:putative ABC transport system substrate-binding protein
MEAFRQGLREVGLVEDKNIFMELRHAEAKPERLPTLAAELVRLKVDVLVSSGPTATAAAKRATSLIPIVMTSTMTPSAAGLSLVSRGPAETSRDYRPYPRRSAENNWSF